MTYKKLNVFFPKVEGVLINSAHNLRYFTGFCGGEGLALITPEHRWLFVDSRYTVAACQEAPDFEVIEFGAGARMREIASRLPNVQSLAFEESYFTVGEFRIFQEALPKVHWVEGSQMIEELRMIKNAEELSFMRQAEQIGVAAFQKVLPMLKPGVTENTVAAELEYEMRRLGASGTSFETIVVSGIKTSMPHGKPGDKKIEPGDFVTMDFGCNYHGYCSDMTRTVVVGRAVPEQKKIYEIVLAAQQKGLAAIRSGILGREADKAARDVIEEEGYGKYFGHSLGHGVGLLIHEQPNLSPKSEICLKPGMVVTCEPGIYIPGFGGVRIEDMVAVTLDGCENLTGLTKELLEL